MQTKKAKKLYDCGGLHPITGLKESRKLNLIDGAANSFGKPVRPYWFDDSRGLTQITYHLNYSHFKEDY